MTSQDMALIWVGCGHSKKRPFRHENVARARCMTQNSNLGRRGLDRVDRAVATGAIEFERAPEAILGVSFRACMRALTVKIVFKICIWRGSVRNDSM